MWINLLLLALGVVVILIGANILTDGAAAIARKCGISELVTGLTIVAFGTSAPELVIGLFSAIKGSSELAVGNVVGSNIFNIFIILGLTAVIKPIKVKKSVMNNEIPLVLLAAVSLFIIGLAPIIDSHAPMQVSRVDGLLLLLFFVIFLRFTFESARSAAPDDPLAENASSKKNMGWPKALIFVILGLAGLVAGGEWFVRGASGVAAALGVSEAIIGLTIVAAGSSLPELATSVTAALKGKPDIALGNVIGSNIFNIFLVLGTTAVVRPLSFGNIGYVDLSVQLIAAILFWVVAKFYKTRTITRPEGSILVALYIIYTIWLIMNA
ncbi:MAG: calcium/sodium antiporter [Paramuribaculum sp.]|nr:calcium/sodium antiporter [Paramuribaculum sp.]